jgi:hypothetical protein
MIRLTGMQSLLVRSIVLILVADHLVSCHVNNRSFFDVNQSDDHVQLICSLEIK